MCGLNSDKGAENKVKGQYKKCYGSHVIEKVIEVSKADFRGDKKLWMLREEEENSNVQLLLGMSKWGINRHPFGVLEQMKNSKIYEWID